MRIDGTDSTGVDDDIDVGDITINGVETLTVTLADLAGLTLGDGTADGIAGNNLKDVTINGGDAGIVYDLGDIVGLAAGRIESVDMSGLVGNVTVEVSGLEDAAIINLGIGTNDVTATEGSGSTQGVTITGNTGADTITGTGLADVINGGSGTDVITGGAGIDTLSGGAGSDTFVYNTIVAAANANNVIDFTAGTLGDVMRIDVVTYTNYAAADGIVLVTASLATALDTGAVLDNTAGAVGSNYIVVDTAANIAAMDLTATTGLTGAGFLAVASDTGDVYYDADGDFSAASVVVGTLTITGSLTAANFEIV
jgi:Ca2+-binding RTX toxin-like protein